MSELLHKWQVAIVWKLDQHQGSKVGRGSGLLISSDLVLTAAHNLYYDMQRVDNQRVNLYPGQFG
jgi:V8-like Glu-specific endopeptidase